jgi:hypothetical protein
LIASILSIRRPSGIAVETWPVPFPGVEGIGSEGIHVPFLPPGGPNRTWTLRTV